MPSAMRNWRNSTIGWEYEMDEIKIGFNPQQLDVLNMALMEMPFKLSAPLVNHINAEIQKARAAAAPPDASGPPDLKVVQ